MKLGVIVAAWALAVCSGMGLVWRYKAKPGAVAEAPTTWPAASAIARAADRPTLIMHAHPLCPCTRASLDELAEIMERFHGRVNAVVLFLQPDGTGREWKEGG